MARIVIFDSGVGGLSIYQEIARRLSEHKHEYVFVSDNFAYPYGIKDESELNQRVLEVMRRIVAQYNPDLAVVACNTASTVVLPLLRAEFSFPVVGVVPAIKPAAAASTTGCIGLLATPATIARSYTDQLIADFAADCEVIRVGSIRLVELAEQKLRGNLVSVEEIEAELQAVIDRPDCDVLVLACTHFPLLNNEISNIFHVKSHSIQLMDSGVGIANRVVSLLYEAEITESPQSSSQAVFTREIEGSTNFVKNLAQLGLDYSGCLQ
ncbi:MAG: glutamate racemase [Pseudomonadota bacterium]